jgi:hypothetical protein
VLSAFVASLDPLCVLQNLGGTLPTTQSLDDLNYRDDDVGWGTVAYALGEMGLREVVLCGHFGCCIAGGWRADNGRPPVPEFSVKNDTQLAKQLNVASELSAPKRASQLWLVEQICGWTHISLIVIVIARPVSDAYSVVRSGSCTRSLPIHAINASLSSYLWIRYYYR